MRGDVGTKERTGSTGQNPPARAPNDPRQYDDLAESWWDLRGRFAMLHWIAQARAQLVPPATREGSVLVDLACGGGLLAPHVTPLGHQHVGVDLSTLALEQARSHGVHVVRGDVTRLPFRDEAADVVVAGEILEHVEDPMGLVEEACRVLRPGGTLVLDTIAATWWGRLTSITVGERIPGGPPKGIHDPALYVDRDELIETARRCGVPLHLVGLRPSAVEYVQWLMGTRERVRMVPTTTAGLFQAAGTKTTQETTR